jgi:hypothetical protein
MRRPLNGGGLGAEPARLRSALSAPLADGRVTDADNAGMQHIMLSATMLDGVLEASEGVCIENAKSGDAAQSTHSACSHYDRSGVALQLE